MSAKSRQVWRYRRKGSDRRIWRACLKTGGRGRANCRISEWCTGWISRYPVMVFAKTKEAAAALSRQIASGLADKFYYAVTDGVPEAGKGQFTDYLLRDGRTNTSAVVESSMPGAKRAELSYEVLEQKNGRAVLRIQLGTGRHHQIRVQLAHAGMPIVGDRKYNFKENMKPSGEPLCLCSYKIGFRHPKTRRNLAFEIDNPFHLS